MENRYREFFHCLCFIMYPSTSKLTKSSNTWPNVTNFSYFVLPRIFLSCFIVVSCCFPSRYSLHYTLIDDFATYIFNMTSLGTLTSPISRLCRFLSFNLSLEVSHVLLNKRFPNGSTTVNMPSKTLLSAISTFKSNPIKSSGLLWPISKFP